VLSTDGPVLRPDETRAPGDPRSRRAVRAHRRGVLSATERGPGPCSCFVDNIFRLHEGPARGSGRAPRPHASSVSYQPTLSTENGFLAETPSTRPRSSITSVQAIYVPARRSHRFFRAGHCVRHFWTPTNPCSRAPSLELVIYPAVTRSESTRQPCFLLPPQIVGGHQLRHRRPGAEDAAARTIGLQGTSSPFVGMDELQRRTEQLAWRRARQDSSAFCRNVLRCRRNSPV